MDHLLLTKNKVATSETVFLRSWLYKKIKVFSEFQVDILGPIWGSGILVEVIHR